MKNLPLIFFILFAGNAMASSLPKCPSIYSILMHDCFGSYTYANGDKYVGEFKDNKKHGQGTFTWGSGAKYVGEFKDGNYHGQGTYTFADGTIERGYYMNGEFVPDICKGMGLTKGTESFERCVLKLIDKIDEDD